MAFTDHPQIERAAPAALLLSAGLLVIALFQKSEVISLGSWTDDFFGRWGYNLMYVLIAVCIICGGLASQRRRAGWLLVAASILIWTAGNLYYTVVLWDAEVIPLFSFSSVCWLIFYPVCLAGLALIFRGERRHEGHGLGLDGLAAGLTVGAFTTAVVFDPVLAADGYTISSLLVLARPIGDTILLSFLIGAAATVGWSSSRGVVLLALGFTTMSFLDFFYQLSIAAGTWVPGTLLEAARVSAFLLVGVGAWQYKSEVHRKLHECNPFALLAVPVFFGMASVGLLVFDHFRPVNLISLFLSAAALAVIVLRTSITFVQNVYMLRSSEAQAVTDSLTGIGNRRKLRDDLEALLDGEDEGFLVMFDLDGFKGYNDSFGHPAGDALLQRLGRSLAQTTTGRADAYRMGGDEFCLLGKIADTSTDIATALGRSALSESGDGFSVSASCGVVNIAAEDRDATTVLREADLRMYAEKNSQRESAALQTSKALLTLLAERSPELREHIAGVEELASSVAERLGLSPAAVEEVRLAAQLHDVGKAAIPDRILKKPGPLNQEEWHFMHQHTIVGERIISAAPALRGVAKLVRSSHEAYDGSGYPDRLAGDDIPLGARIVAVCDAFDAMTSDRPYRERIEVQEALTELQRCAGAQFAPETVSALVDVILEQGIESLVADSAQLENSSSSRPVEGCDHPPSLRAMITTYSSS